LEPLLFSSQYDAKIDSKSRLFLAAEVRRRIKPEIHGKGFYLTVGYNRRPWLYPSLYYEHLRNQEKRESIPGIAQSDFDLVALAMAQEIDEPDAQGRILIPARTYEWTGITKEQTLAILGVRDHLELWDRNEWDAKRRELLNKLEKVNELARQAQQDQQKSP